MENREVLIFRVLLYNEKGDLLIRILQQQQMKTRRYVKLKQNPKVQLQK